jgi:dCMP deaminase
MQNSKSWDVDFIALAESWAKRKSKDPSTQVGAVIVRPNRSIVSMGYNGFPQGMNDDGGLYAHRPTKSSRVIHAEMNAAIFAREDLTGCTLYTWPFAPCDRCAVHMIQMGIKRVVAPKTPHDANMAAAISLGVQYFDEAGVDVCLYDLS